MLIHVLFGVLKKGTSFACSICLPEDWEEFSFSNSPCNLSWSLFFKALFNEVIMPCSCGCSHGAGISAQHINGPVPNYTTDLWTKEETWRMLRRWKMLAINQRKNWMPEPNYFWPPRPIFLRDDFCECHTPRQIDGDGKTQSIWVAPSANSGPLACLRTSEGCLFIIFVA